MSSEGVTYDNARFGDKKIMVLPRIAPAANNDAAEVLARVAHFVKMKVTGARGIVRTAGVATTSAIKILSGTTSIGQILLATKTADSVVDATITETTFTKDTGVLSFQQVVATDTGAADVMVEYQEAYEGV